MKAEQTTFPEGIKPPSESNDLMSVLMVELQKHATWIKSGGQKGNPGNFEILDLSRKDLSNVDFSHAGFRGANLSGSKLDGASFVGCDLRETNLNGASLKGTDFRGADLTGAAYDADALGQARIGSIDVTDASGTRTLESKLNWVSPPPLTTSTLPGVKDTDTHYSKSNFARILKENSYEFLDNL